MTTPVHDASPDSAKLNSDSDSTSDPIFTPPDSEYRFPSPPLPDSTRGGNSPSPLRLSSLPDNAKDELHPVRQQHAHFHEEEDAHGSESVFDEDEDGDMAGRPGMHRTGRPS